MRGLLLLAIALGGCKVSDRPPPDDAAAVAGGAEPVPIAAGELGDLDFTYATLSGAFRTARGADAVPVPSRRLVRVTWPTADLVPAGDDDRVHAVDLTRPADGGRYTTALMRELEFESRALARLPPGLASRVTVAPGRAPAALSARPRVHIYGALWCEACKMALDYFARRFPGVAGGDAVYLLRDVDQAEAAAELADLGLALGIDIDRIPVIDVRGRVIVGFDERRLDALLGDRL